MPVTKSSASKKNMYSFKALKKQLLASKTVLAKAILPSSKPKLTQAEVEQLLSPLGLDFNKFKLVVIGIRGYYKNSMGAPNVNDRGIYDDAIFLYSPQLFSSFNGNTDPSIFRNKTSAQKGIASLQAGVWYAHKFDLHKGKYMAICQRLADVTVKRDGDPNLDTGMFGINIHRGGYNTTSSEGCQTIHPDQWESFISSAIDQAKRFYGTDWNKKCIPYVLLEQ